MSDIHITRKEATTHWIPTFRRREPISAASRVASLRDIVERRYPRGVQERVQEPERLSSIVEYGIIQEGYHTRDSWARRARAGDRYRLPVKDDPEALRLCGYIRKPAAGGIEQAFVCVAEVLQVGRDRAVLVLRTREDIGEAACRKGCGDLWSEAGRPANGRYAA